MPEAVDAALAVDILVGGRSVKAQLGATTKFASSTELPVELVRGRAPAA